MKELIIIRHAKSDWGQEFLNDIDRHLSERGLADAYFMSEWYKKKHAKPDLILSSTATRALSTAFIFARKLEVGTEQLLLEPKIYEASVDTLLSVIHSQNNAHQSMMLFGHNPSLTELCNSFSKDLYFEYLPTCGIASYKFNTKNWKDITALKGELNYYEFPKNFKKKE